MAAPNKGIPVRDVDTASLENDRLHMDLIRYVDCPSVPSNRLSIVRHKYTAYREKTVLLECHIFIAADSLRSVMSKDGRDAEPALAVQLQQGSAQ